MNLRDVCGINVHLGQQIDIAIDAGIRHYRVDAMPNIWNPAPGAFDFTILDEALAKIKAAPDCTALLVCFAVPAWRAPGQPIIPGWTYPPATSYMDESLSAQWRADIDLLSNRYPWAAFEIATEISLPKYFAGTPQDYINWVIKPAAEVLKAKACVTVGIGHTLQGENDSRFKEGMNKIIRPLVEQCENDLTKLSIHCYRQSAADTIADLNRFLGRRVPYFNLKGKVAYRYEHDFEWFADEYGRDWISEEPHGLWVTETGFSSQNDAVQLAEYIALLDAIESAINPDSGGDPSLGAYERFYFYHLISGGAGLLNDDGSPRPAFEELKRRLM